MPDVVLDEPQEALLTAKFMATLSIMINTISTYLVIFHSGEMKTFRWFLLNFMLTSCVFDFYVCFLMCPVNLYPYVAGFTVGPLWRIFRVSTHTQLIILWYLGMCQIITVFLNFYWRFQAALLPTSFWKLSQRSNFIGIAVLYVLFAVPSILGIFANNDRDALKEYFHERNDSVALMLLDEQSVQFYIFSINPWLHYGTFIVAGSIGVNTVLIYAMIIATVRGLQATRESNERNQQIHLYFLRCLIFQLIPPMLFLSLPLTVMISTVVYGLDFQYFNHWMMVLFTIHSPIASISVMVLTEPYRSALRQCFSYTIGARRAAVAVSSSQEHPFGVDQIT